MQGLDCTDRARCGGLSLYRAEIVLIMRTDSLRLPKTCAVLRLLNNLHISSLYMRTNVLMYRRLAAVSPPLPRAYYSPVPFSARPLCRLPPRGFTALLRTLTKRTCSPQSTTACYAPGDQHENEARVWGLRWLPSVSI